MARRVKIFIISVAICCRGSYQVQLIVSQSQQKLSVSNSESIIVDREDIFVAAARKEFEYMIKLLTEILFIVRSI